MLHTTKTYLVVLATMWLRPSIPTNFTGTHPISYLSD